MCIALFRFAAWNGRHFFLLNVRLEDSKLLSLNIVSVEVLVFVLGIAAVLVLVLVLVLSI